MEPINVDELFRQTAEKNITTLAGSLIRDDPHPFIARLRIAGPFSAVSKPYSARNFFKCPNNKLYFSSVVIFFHFTQTRGRINRPPLAHLVINPRYKTSCQGRTEPRSSVPVSA